jgi:predicted dehydrogenase
MVLAGAGRQGAKWLAVLAAHGDVELAGVSDVDPARARSVIAAAGLDTVPTAADVFELADRVGADAIVNVTPPAAHHPVALEALRRGMAVLGEKPMAETLSEAVQLVAAADATGGLFAVSQNYQQHPGLAQLRAQSAGLGRLSLVSVESHQALRSPGYRADMAHPLLVEMAIHLFDSARFVTGAEPVAVYCDEYRPPGSWFDGAPAALVVAEMTGGTRLLFNGDWCAAGRRTAWDGRWAVSGERGTAFWDGESPPVVREHGDRESAAAPAHRASGVADLLGGVLTSFIDALRGGPRPWGDCRNNLMSTALLHAALLSAAERRQVIVAEVLEQARQTALRAAAADLTQAIAGISFPLTSPRSERV